MILKRFEIWLLFAVIAALFTFAFRPHGESIKVLAEPDNSVVQSDQATAPHPATDPKLRKEPYTIEAVDIVPTEQGQIVELTLMGRSQSGEEIPLNNSTLSAMTSEGEPLDFFFEPFREEAFFTGGEDSLATVKLWLESPTEVIWLDLQGSRLKAKLPK